MNIDPSILQKVFWGNSIEKYLIFITAFFSFSLFFYLFQLIVVSRLRAIAIKNESAPGNTFLHIISSIRPPFFYFLSFYLALQYLNIGDKVRSIIYAFLVAWVIYEVIFSLQLFIDYLVKKSFGKEREKDAKAALGPIKITASIVLWLVGILFLFSNLGINVTSLIAGLGISGIAVALAAQSILRDLFSSFVIIFDKPFLVGDYIVVGDSEGIVKQIGLRTTRLQALEGEEIIISNQELSTIRIKNYSKLKERRVTIPFKIDNSISGKQLASLSSLIEKSLSKIDNVRLDRTTITGLNKDGIDFEVVYFIESNRYKTYIEVQEKALLVVRELLEEEKIKLS